MTAIYAYSNFTLNNIIMKILYIGILFLFFSCNVSNNKKEITNLINKWNEKEIIFPTDYIDFISSNKELSVDSSLSNYKILIYIDSIGCSSCKLQLNEWKIFMKQVDSLTNNHVKFLFILHPKEIREIKVQAKINKFNYPLYFDKNDELNKLNKFPSDIAFHTFLLDRENKVILLGNPVSNPKIKELYINKILNKGNIQIDKTEIEVDNLNIDFGKFNWNKPQERTIHIKNTGKNNLTILDIASSCGCTVPEYDLKTVPSGEIINLKITFTAERPEYFERNVIIHCNTKESPIEIKLKGNAI